ncbi:DUF3142 domain-containing protein [Trichlorobacter lovleyi]|uniref:DUF3142 domain-containing protein n=1 Tax=Trichlorobacter lovleyi TaxID=313985 RepID=UPI00223ECE6A|nr:DUF3142 domain-containing protein [Trichlorobacter lovleyi]QOX78145.1 DUF3142 domain-containing protein [Trichlorobacter lovleyi]
MLLRQLAALLLTTLALACIPPPPADAGVVRAEQYSSFWLWGGVQPQPVLAQAQTLYILQGQVIEKKQQGRMQVAVVAQGMSVARLKKGKVWLVYRADTLNWTPAVVEVLLGRLRQWQQAGNPVVGLQVDFDVKTRHLPEYVAFLKQLRAALPTIWQLSITGLLDWGSNGDSETINQLNRIVDEVVVQTYQGRKSIPTYKRYLPALKRLTLPFKIGLIQQGEWVPDTTLEASPWFRGYVVFLQNQASP